MRILIVADHFPPAVGGLAVQAERMSARLAALGHEIATLSVGAHRRRESRSGYELLLEPLSLDRLPNIYQEGSPSFHPPWPDPSFRKAAASLIRRFRPDLIHVHGWSLFSVASLTGDLPPVVVTLHDYGLVCPKKSLMRHGRTCATGRGIRCFTCDSEAQPTPRRTALAAALTVNVPIFARHIDRWIAVSEYVATRHAGLPDAVSRMRVIPPLVDLPAPCADEPEQPPYILYVGAGDENPDKGRALLLEAFGRASVDPYRLVLVGGREPVASGHVEDRGYLKGEDLDRAFRGATFTVVPSRWPDPCPAVAVEALANGRPVIASGVGGLTEIVNDGKTGLLVPPGDAVALSAALRRLVSDSELRDSMARAARPSVARFATEEVLSEHEQLYAEVIAARASPSGIRAA